VNYKVNEIYKLWYSNGKLQKYFNSSEMSKTFVIIKLYTPMLEISIHINSQVQYRCVIYYPYE